MKPHEYSERPSFDEKIRTRINLSRLEILESFDEKIKLTLRLSHLEILE